MAKGDLTNTVKAKRKKGYKIIDKVTFDPKPALTLLRDELLAALGRAREGKGDAPRNRPRGPRKAASGKPSSAKPASGKTPPAGPQSS